MRIKALGLYDAKICSGNSPCSLWSDSELDPDDQQPGRRRPPGGIPETSHDFGKVFEDKELTHTFIIKNTGDTPLHIKDIDSLAR
jgi:hypothetical protein